MAPDPDHTADRVQALDLLRLVSVVGVVLYHYGFRGPDVNGVAQVAIPGVASVAMYGFLGVPVFFIISGFVIAYSAQGRTATGFAIARFSRIYPTYLACMTLTFAVVLLFGAPHFAADARQWLANLAIAAPALDRPYMDGAYWSLVVEITFYAWVTGLIATKLFPRRIDVIVLVWLGISMLNEITFDARIVERILLADHSGFFATGLMIYEHYKGRRDGMFWAILALSIGAAVFQALHNLGWLRLHSGDRFDDWIVAGICLASIGLIFLATRIRRVPLPARLVVAAGAITYPLYLLHMQIGYTIWMASGAADPAVTMAAIFCGVVIVSWGMWRAVDRPVQRWTRDRLTGLAGRMGWPSRPVSAAGSS